MCEENQIIIEEEIENVITNLKQNNPNVSVDEIIEVIKWIEYMRVNYTIAELVIKGLACIRYPEPDEEVDDEMPNMTWMVWSPEGKEKHDKLVSEGDDILKEMLKDMN